MPQTEPMSQEEARIALAASLRPVNPKLRAKALAQPRNPKTGQFVGPTPATCHLCAAALKNPSWRLCDPCNDRWTEKGAAGRDSVVWSEKEVTRTTLLQRFVRWFLG